MCNDVFVALIKKGPSTTDSSGNAIFPELESSVYAEQKSVRQSEFFQAASVGFKPEMVLEVYSFEYKGEEICRIGENRYRIYRTYQIPDTDRTELYLTAIVGDTDAFA